MRHVPPGRPTDDPFLGIVRRRHLDVDLVLLDGDPEPPRPGPVVVASADEAAVVAAVRRVDEATARCARVVGCAGAPTRLHRSALAGEVVARARVVLAEGDHRGALTRIAHALRADGWEVHRFDRAVERVEAHTPDLRLRASYAATTGVLVWQVESSRLVVGVDLARSLVGAA